MCNKPESVPGFIQDWANKIKQSGLTAPAILLLEAHRPLGFVASQFLLLGQPVLDLLVPPHVMHNVISLFSNRPYLERLIRELERD